MQLLEKTCNPHVFHRSFFKQEVIKVIQPLLLWKIIQYFENYDPDDHQSLVMVYIYAAAMSLSAFGLSILQHLYYYQVMRIGMKMRVAVCHMIYRKVSEDSSRFTDCRHCCELFQ